MSSGTISGTTSTSSVLSRIRWTCEIDIATNTSVVTAQLAYQTTSNWHSGTFEGFLWIDGTKFECQKAITLQPNGSWVAVGTFSKTIQHNADGTKAIEIYATGGISGTAFNSTTCSAIVTLETIPRTTTPTTSGDFNVGSSVTINLPRAADTFTHTVQFSLNAADWTTIATSVATSATWTLPASLATALPNATSGTVYIRAITYSSGTEIGSETISRTYYVTSAYAAPSASIAISQSNSANIGQYIRGKSTVTLTATASALKYGATAVRYAFTYGGVTQTVTSSNTSASVSFALPSNAAASYAYSVMLTDSRGYTASASGTVTTAAYSAPSISSLTATRGNYDGSTFTANETGKSLKIVASGTITSLSNANAKKYALDYRLQTATAYTSLVASTTASSYAFSLTYYTTAIFSEYSAYTIRLTLTDSFGSVAQTVNVTSKQVVLNFNADGTAMGIGTIAGESGALKLGWGLIPHQPLCPANLLDNSDFANPINQRGNNATSYRPIDRWISTGVTLNDGSITVTQTGSDPYFQQHLMPTVFKNCVHTLAAKKADGTVVCYSYNPLNTYKESAAGMGLGYYSGNGCVLCRLRPGEYLWAALYEGEYTAGTLPTYRPKGYAAELVECMRYYQVGGEIQFTHSSDVNGAIGIYCRFPVPMRAVPTMTHVIKTRARNSSSNNATLYSGAITHHSMSNTKCGAYITGFESNILYIVSHEFTASAEL